MTRPGVAQPGTTPPGMTRPGANDPVGAAAWRVRPARRDDIPCIDALVRELAAYEREPDAVQATQQDFANALFGADPHAYCHVAEVTDDEGTSQVAGIAVWYLTFSTWRGRHGIWLEDLFVRPEHRGLGLGRALLGALAQVCTERGYARLEWWVLDWNTPAHGFYRSLGAVPQEEWTVWRVDGDQLGRLASPDPSSDGENKGSTTAARSVTMGPPAEAPGRTVDAGGTSTKEA